MERMINQKFDLAERLIKGKIGMNQNTQFQALLLRLPFVDILFTLSFLVAGFVIGIQFNFSMPILMGALPAIAYLTFCIWYKRLLTARTLVAAGCELVFTSIIGMLLIFILHYVTKL